MNLINAIDLFAGAGGLSEGFRQAGYNILAHVEMDKSACNTLRTREAYYYLKKKRKLNLYKSYLLSEITREELYSRVPPTILNRVIESEISTRSLPTIFQKIDDSIEGNLIDIIIGGPPCQAYSTAGISRDPNRMKDDPRNYFYKHYLEFLKRYRPKLFVFENVKGILTSQKGAIFEDLKKEFGIHGYNLEYKILNAKEFGVVQSRERVIILGWRNDIEFKYPEFKYRNRNMSIKELFDDLPLLQAGEKINGKGKYLKDKANNTFIRNNKWDILTYHIARPQNDNDLEIYRTIVQGWNSEKKSLKYNELPLRLRTHKNEDTFLDRYKQLKYNEVSHTIVAHISKDGHYYIHPDINQNRSISVREAARIQSFPDDFYFEDSRTAAFKQIGNAVPPLMAKKIAEKIKPQLL